MGWEAWFTLAVLAVALVAMARDQLEPALALGGALGVLLLAGVLTAEKALAGFANPAVAIVALLLVMAGALERSPWIDWLAGVLFGNHGESKSLVRALFPVAGLSAFMSNTAVVSVLIPAVRAWARRRGAPPSKFLMAISFVSILGGVCTLVGTSTNLVVHGMLLETSDPGFGMFELARVGIPVAVLGIVYLALFGYRLLPARSDPLEKLHYNGREYVTRLRVAEESPLVGENVAALRRLQGLFLVSIERNGVAHSPARPQDEIRSGDTLVFAGLVDTIAELAAMPGVSAANETEGSGARLGEELSQLVEAVVSPSSPLVGQNIREAGFRSRYDAAVLAVHRHGERVASKIGDIVVRPGDTLLLLSGQDFLTRWQYSQDFYLVSNAGRMPQSVRPGDWVEPAALAGAVLAATLGLLSLLEAVVAGVVLLIVSRRLRPADIWASLNWRTLIIIATGIGLGNALVESGAAASLARAVMGWPSAFGPVGVIAAVLIAAAVLTEFTTNIAAAALMFPVALLAAQQGLASVHALAAAVAVGASASFMTPIGYQTNTMVAGAAGYKFRDFVRVGLPLKLIVLLVSSILIPIVGRM